MAEEEQIIDFGFSAVTADEYEKDQTDGEIKRWGIIEMLQIGRASCRERV